MERIVQMLNKKGEEMVSEEVGSVIWWIIFIVIAIVSVYVVLNFLK